MRLEEEEELERYRKGFQGACYACENVGSKNVELEAALAQAKTDRQQCWKGQEKLLAEIARLREALPDKIQLAALLESREEDAASVEYCEGLTDGWNSCINAFTERATPPTTEESGDTAGGEG